MRIIPAAVGRAARRPAADGRGVPGPVRAGQPGEVGVPLLAVGVQGRQQGPAGVEPLGLRGHVARDPRSSTQRLPAVSSSNRSRAVSSPPAGSSVTPDGQRGPVGLDDQLRPADERLARRLPLDPDPDLRVGLVGPEPGLDRQRRLDARATNRR